MEDTLSRLRRDLGRLSSLNPFDILAVPVNASVEKIRESYLQLTKKMHPNRYARERPDVQALANEVFLLVRNAYDQLSDEPRRKAWLAKIGRGTSTPPGGVTLPKTPATIPPAAKAPATIPPASKIPVNMPS